METLSDQLTTIYNKHWKNLMDQLDANGLRDKLQCPFLISLYRSGQKGEEREKAKNADPDCWYAKKADAEHEEWYTKADLKIMFFGREPNWWKRYNEEGETIDVGDLTAVYEDFLDDNYNAEEGYFFHEGISSGNRFLRLGVNGIMYGVREILKDYPNKRVSMIWNEISKLSKRKGNGGEAVGQNIHNIERKYFPVISEEVKITKPDIIIFLTGAEDSKYNAYIRENFNIIGDPIALSNLSTNDVEKLQIEGIKLSYITHHPGYSPKGESTNDFHWRFYNAILADIKENIDKLLKKE